MDFYTDWVGNEYILLMTPRAAERLGVRVR